jgi:hypothetical protein
MKNEAKDKVKKGSNPEIIEEHIGSEHMKTFFIGIAAAFILIAGIAGVSRMLSNDTEAATGDQPTEVLVGPQESLPGNYHAVFLTNGQVYFGRVTSRDRYEVVLENIYYLQSDKQMIAQGLDNQKELKLIKLGNELHGPEDMMYINRDQVLFIEPLKDDSKVVKAIRDYTIK